MRTFHTLLSTALLLPAFAQVPFHCGADELHRVGDPMVFEAEFQERMAQAEAELEDFTRSFQDLERGGSGGYVIPVVFHIIHNNGPENISDAQIYDAVRVLNNDFNRLNADWDNVRPEFLDIVANVGIEFRLATRDPQGNCTNGITRTVSPLTNEGSNQMKALISWPRSRYLQVWVAASADGAAGYTYRPAAAAGIPSQDGIVLQHIYTGSIGTSTASRSRTLTHEVGHWLNLAHTWGNSNNPGLDGNCNDDDNVADTPNTRGWTSCTLSGSSCGSPLDNVENYMEYSYCSKMFTEGQKVRMIAALNSGTAQRNQLWQTSNLINTGVNGNATLCAASFISNTREVCAGQAVYFTDQSYHNVTSRTWTFPGGTPSTSSETNPVVYYNESGVFPATLAVSDGSTTVSASQQNFIVVLPNPGQTPPVTEGFETASQPSDIGWTVIDNDNDNGFQITTAASYSGSKSLRLVNTAQMSGRVDRFVSPTYDMSDATQITLSFRYAYARRTSTSADQFRIYASSNCGETWSLRSQLFATSDLNTGGIVAGTFVPTNPSQWGYKELTTINSNFHVSDMRIRFEFFSDGGNHFYLDDINLNGVSVGLEELTGSSGGLLQVMPNPASSKADVLFNLEHTGQVRLELLDPLGRTVQVVHDGNMARGEHRLMLPIAGLSAGVYLVRIQDADGTSGTVRLVID